MSREYREFESGRNTIQLIVSRKDLMGRDNDVKINWSCSGAVTIDEARHFKNKLSKVIADAEYEQSLLDKQ